MKLLPTLALYWLGSFLAYLTDLATVDALLASLFFGTIGIAYGWWVRDCPTRSDP